MVNNNQGVQMKIKLLVDSASDIDAKEAKDLGIEMIPMEVNFGEQQYYDGVNLDKQEFYNKLIETNVIPKTSQINVYRFAEKFTELTQDGSAVLCITISSKLSGSYNSAVSAAKKFGDKVQVVDSLNVTIGERILVQYAMQLIQRGDDLATIVQELNQRKHQIHLVALVDTLKYLQLGGRISKVTAFVGTLVNIKPVIAIIGGEVKIIGKAMGSKKGNNMLVQQITKAGGIDFAMPYATAYSGLSDVMLQKYLADSQDLWQGHTDRVPTYLVGSTIGTHAGPGAVAVAFFSLPTKEQSK